MWHLIHLYIFNIQSELWNGSFQMKRTILQIKEAYKPKLTWKIKRGFPCYSYDLWMKTKVHEFSIILSFLSHFLSPRNYRVKNNLLGKHIKGALPTTQHCCSYKNCFWDFRWKQLHYIWNTSTTKIMSHQNHLHLKEKF